jgi:hypothetical protein
MKARFHIPEEGPCAVMVGSLGQPLPETDLRAAWDIKKARLLLESARRLGAPDESALL